MQPFNTDRISRLEKFYDRLDQFLIPLAERDDADVPVTAKTSCRFGCPVQLQITPSEWQHWRATNHDIDQAMPTTPAEYRRFLETGLCPNCSADMQPSDNDQVGSDPQRAALTFRVAQQDPKSGDWDYSISPPMSEDEAWAIVTTGNRNPDEISWYRIEHLDDDGWGEWGRRWIDPAVNQRESTSSGGPTSNPTTDEPF